MIQRVYEGVREARLVDRIVVATDDERIQKAARSFGAEAVLTSRDHSSGTERVAEVAHIIDNNIIINVQGDEPLVTGGLGDALIQRPQDEEGKLARTGE